MILQHTVNAVLAGIDEGAAARCLADLVRIPTVNPPGDEAPLAAHVAERLEALGFSVRLDEVLPGRPNLIARLHGRAGSPTLLFNTHMDVVAPGAGWTRDPFAAEVVDGRLYGRGALDAKGSLAGFLLAAGALAGSGTPLDGNLVVTAVMDEEVGSLGARRLAPAVAADHAIVGEPTGLDVAIAHRGSLRPVIAVEGRAAHASQPGRGVNAVYLAARAIAAFEAHAGALGGRAHPLVGRPTLAVTIVHGGHKENVIPDRCEFTIDRRLIPEESEPEALAGIERVLAGLRAAHPDFRAGIARLLPTTGGPSETPADAPIVGALLAAGRAVLGRKVAVAGFPAACDMVHFRAAGVPTAVLGPGDLSRAHTADEWVDIREVADAARIYALAALSLLAPAADR
jgi:acetylornithine deacetylase/succinyl-diaminopimelate desuccinylase family protein